jgi:hypothetical protein
MIPALVSFAVSKGVSMDRHGVRKMQNTLKKIDISFGR